jgi:hypothetical protein
MRSPGSLGGQSLEVYAAAFCESIHVEILPKLAVALMPSA